MRLRGRVAALENDLAGNKQHVQKLKTELEQAEAKRSELLKKQIGLFCFNDTNMWGLVDLFVNSSPR